MTITQPAHPAQFQMPFRSDPPRPSLLEHLPARQTPPSAMPSPALLAPLEPDPVQPQTFEDEDHFFDIGRNSPLMDYGYRYQRPDFSDCQPVISPRLPAPPDALEFASQLRPGVHYPDVSSEHDPNCPRVFSNWGPDNPSVLSLPSAYQFPTQQQPFCFSSPEYQLASTPLDGPVGNPPPPMDNIAYLTSSDHCPSHRTTPEYQYHLDQDFGQPFLDYRGCQRSELEDKYRQRQDPGRSLRDRPAWGRAEQDDKNDDKNEPYAKLIHRALMEAPDHIMSLRELYGWFLRETDKPNESNHKGWQNSIRHNLSMNGAFEKVEQPAGEDSKKANMWRLTDEAIHKGVKSTTRYRKKEQHKRGSKNSHNPNHRPSAQRQAAGARGGDATKRSSERRQVQQRQQSEQELFDNRLGMPHAASLNLEDEPCPNPFWPDRIPDVPLAPYVHPLDDQTQHNLFQSEPRELRGTSLSPAAFNPCQAFPQSPMQDQIWACSTMADVPPVFTSTTSSFPFESAYMEVTPSTAPSSSDGDSRTPTNSTGDWGVDPNSHLGPPAPPTFF